MQNETENTNLQKGQHQKLIQKDGKNTGYHSQSRKKNPQNINRQRWVRKMIEFACMTAGALIMAVGVYFFKIPNGFSTGGVSGIATLLGKMIPSEYVTPAMLVMIINALLLVLGFLVIGRATGARTVYCSLAFSGFTLLFERICPMEAPLTNQPLLELVYAILLTGIGSAILFWVGASSGGTDIVALILKKYTSLDVGKALLCTDFLIAVSSFYVFDMQTGLFSLLGLFAKAFLVDGVIESLYVCKSFMIITSHPEPVVQYILHTLKHSATTVDACGEYTGEEKKMVITVCKRAEAVHLRRFIRQTDPEAFVIVESANEIIGRGFRQV